MTRVYDSMTMTRKQVRWRRPCHQRRHLGLLLAQVFRRRPAYPDVGWPFNGAYYLHLNPSFVHTLQVQFDLDHAHPGWHQQM